MLHIKNVLPTFFIIAETKIVEDGIRGFFNKTNPKFFTNLDEKNKVKISDNEKLVETIGNICNFLPSESTNNNKDYFVHTRNNFQNILKHTQVTVAFNNVSQCFIDKLHRMHAKIEIHQRELENEELKFWLLPTYEDDEELAFRFAELFESFGTLKQKLETDISSKANRNMEKDMESIKRLLPNSYALDAVVTTDLLTWREMFLEYTNFKYDDELRYVLLFVAKQFKLRYSNALHDLILVDKSDNILGLDSLKIDGKIWRNARINTI